MNTSFCASSVASLSQFLPIKIVLSIHSFIGITAIFLSFFTIRQYAKAYFHINCKLLVITLLLMYIVHGLSLSTSFLYHVITLSLPPGCQALLTPIDCLFMRGPSNICIFLFTCLHFSLSIERILARFYGFTYERQGPFYGILLASLSLMCASGIFGFIMYSENWDPSNLVPICSIGNKYTGDNAARCMGVLLLLDLIGSTLMIHSYWKEFRQENKSYDIRTRFNCLERRDMNSLLLPFTAMHTIFYIIYEAVYLICTQILITIFPPLVYKAIFMAVNFIPYYTVLSNFVLIHLLNRMYQQKRRKWTKNFTQSTDKRIIHSAYMNGW